MIHNFTTVLCYLLLITNFISLSQATKGKVKITGELKKWHKVTLTFNGPQASESSLTPNPFSDYRLNVIFTNGKKKYTVPGYFTCDGNAHTTSATSGNKWRVHFTPDTIGTWRYDASFRTGFLVNIDPSANAGKAVSFDGDKGQFVIKESDKASVSSRDHRGKGRLEYVGGHYLRFAETGEYFIKQGADSPENFLAYDGFDNTPNYGDRRKSWNAHTKDWTKGDPTWKGGKGKGIIGAINYLSAKGMNAFSFLTMNINGDDKNVFPFISDDPMNFMRYDCSKLDQWEIVFDHADKMGMFLHFKTQETENDQLLDGGNLGPMRKLYYRELIARYSHHLALNWNLGEENSNTDSQRRDFASFFRDNDPYSHPIVIHNGHSFDDFPENTFGPMLGKKSDLTGLSIQAKSEYFSDVYDMVRHWVAASEKSGKKWVVAVDESGSAGGGVRPDKDANDDHAKARTNGLWGTIMAGGAGCEYFFGMLYDDNDMTCQDFRSRDRWWDYCRYALDFFHGNDVPFWDMTSCDVTSETRHSWSLCQMGARYVIYVKTGGTAVIDLTGSTSEGVYYSVKWYDPRNGGVFQNGSVTLVKAGDSNAYLGLAPSNMNDDWLIYVEIMKDQTMIYPSASPSIASDTTTTVVVKKKCPDFDTRTACSNNNRCWWNGRQCRNNIRCKKQRTARQCTKRGSCQWQRGGNGKKGVCASTSKRVQ